MRLLAVVAFCLITNTATDAQSSAWPGARARHHLVYDPTTQRVLMYGGTSRDSAIWIWGGNSWRSVASSLAPRSNEAVAFDAVRNRLIVHGGSERPDETWEWDGAAWHRMNATGPGQRGHH